MKPEEQQIFVLSVSRRFPSYHSSAGMETRFIEKNLYTKEKLHTIRTNYDLWEKRINMINKGGAILSLRNWEGRQYYSKQFEFLRLSYVGIQMLTFPTNSLVDSHVDSGFVDSHIIATNDGLDYCDFENWFSHYDLSKPMAIIHFTGLSYCPLKANYENKNTGFQS